MSIGLLQERRDQFGELIDLTNGFTRDGMTTEILMHGRGMGDDGPLLTPRSKGDEIRSLLLEKGNTWVWKPTVTSQDGRIAFTWGGDVVVGQRGGEVLFERPHGIVSVG